MTTLLSVMSFALLFALFLVTAMVLLCLFVYSDAKTHSDIPALWVVLVLFVPNFIGLLLYFLLGRHRSVLCKACGAHGREDARFCPQCGGTMAGAIPAGLSPSAKRFLILFLSAIGLAVIALAAMLAAMFTMR